MSSMATSIELAIFGAVVKVMVAPWCKVFHHFTEK